VGLADLIVVRLRSVALWANRCIPFLAAFQRGAE